MNKKKIITWKDADQNLCTIAASILDAASLALRSAQSTAQSWPVDGGGTVSPGFVEASGNRTYWTGSPNAPTAALSELDHNSPTAQCWWCFQNMVRMRLEDARKELKANRYLRKNALRESTQKSRNPVTRPERGKYNRRPERE